MLTRDQPQTLLSIAKFALKNGDTVPTGKELAAILNIDERAASARIKRIIGSFPDCFVVEGKTRRINYEMLCTEVESAIIFLNIYKKCSESDDGRILRKDVLALIYGDQQKDKENFIKKACKAGYLQEIAINHEYIRVGNKAHGQLPYLELLAKTKKQLTLAHSK